MRKAIIDLDTGRLLEVEGKVLTGECLRCGKCCRDCEHLIWDTYLDHARTKSISRCGFQIKKFCILAPYPEDVMPEGCGFNWRNK